nr:restriction endonuclease subunit S [Mycolicibacterium malmesburyense]CRL76799.1 restriction endonuclease S subunits-like protein [Mycolicibacterium malmesburyense]
MSDWPTVPLGTLLTDIQPGFASGRHNSEGEGIPHFRPMNVSTNGQIERSVLKYVEPSTGRPEIRLSAGDILFNNTNSPELVGKTALFDGDDSPAFSNHMTRLRVDPNRLDPGYTALRLHQAWREGWFAAHCNNHVSQASIGRDVIKGFEIELPPLDVQHAIVSLSDAIGNSRLSASSHLSAARIAIERFRQAVLAAACSGRLTADWRKAHPEAVATVPTVTPSRKRRSAEAQPLDLELPDLPETYVLTTIGAAAVILEYGTSKKADNDTTGVPVLRMGNIQDGRLALDDLKYCATDREIERLILQDGDLLFNRTNSPELVGKAAVFHETESMTFASYLIRARFPLDVADPDFVNYWLNSAWGRAWARHVKTDGVSQSNINGTKLGAMPLPLPPIAEQREIVRRSEALLDKANRLTTAIDAASKRIDRSSQAILAKAFRGELVGNGLREQSK